MSAQSSSIQLYRCCQTNEPEHQCLVDGYCYEITKERHSVRAASRFSLNVLRFESEFVSRIDCVTRHGLKRTSVDFARA